MIIVAALAALGYWAWRHKHESDAAAREEAAQVTSTHAVPKRPIAAPPPAAASTSAATATTGSAPANDETLRLEIVATARSEIVLEADGKTLFDGEMPKGARKSYSAKERFLFRTIGNAGGITLTLNDVTLPPLGGDGDVVHDKLLDRDLLARERAEPHPNP